jgi:hypothetical protein
MQRVMPPAFLAGCLLGLALACFGPVVLRDEQFSYRDAGDFYYPLYHRVQQEWGAGRWPLWEPEENGGMPLLGNPVAAVLYPGKILYALPTAWAARLYVIAHVALAFAAMLVLLRSWRVSRTGSSLGAIAYAFGAPVLSQYCNVIYLVGVAWAPLGLCAVDRLVRLGKRRGLVELAAVLALQILGGDPESAYLVVSCGGLYALGLSWYGGRGSRAGDSGDEDGARRGGSVTPRVGLVIVAVMLAWVGITLGAAAWIKAHRARLPWNSLVPDSLADQIVLLTAWGLAAALLWRYRRGRPGARRLAGSLAALVGSSALAMGLGAAQILPVLEFSRLSVRAAGEGQHDIYPFSVEPCRAVEWVWPGFFGTHRHPERNWLNLVPPSHTIKPWAPSLYLGGLTLVLALGAAGFRGGPPWRAWLTFIALGSALGALGEFGSPVWWARALPGMRQTLGDHDPSINHPTNRSDGGVADGDGSFYWLLAAVLPGFQTFRYPGKLLTFTSIALSALAGLGWDRWRGGAAARAPAALLVLSLVALAAVVGSHDRLVRLFDAAGRGAPSFFGPFDPRGAVADLRRALGQGAIVMAIAVALAAAARRRARWAGPAALLVLTVDLAVANSPLVVTAPQALFDRKPKLVRLIEEAEKRDPSPGPFRVHRMPLWYPLSWFKAGAADRALQVTRWEHDTIRSKYGLLGGLSYTLTGGSVELFDYGLFFAGFDIPLDTGRVPLRDAEHGQPILYYTRRGYDLWNTRYFVLPMDPAGWREGSRGFASFLADREMIAPDPDLLEDPRNGEKLEAWIRDEDWQLLRNKAAYPRAWVVHKARFLKPIHGLAFEDRAEMMEEILFADDAFWSDPGRRVFDPHALAWIETDDFRPLAPYARGGPKADPSESVAVTRYEPRRVELEARLRRPGIVVLADLYYPGWTLTLDGKPAPILRANRLMRGAAVAAGTHRLVYTYDPPSFRLGGLISLASIALGLVLGVRAPWRRASGEAGDRPANGPPGSLPAESDRGLEVGPSGAGPAR